MTYENFDVLIGIDRRGVAHVIQHRTQPTKNVQAEVTLTTTYTRTDRFSSEESDTGLLEAPEIVASPGVARAARVGVDAAGIKSILLGATSLADQWVKISGHKVDGTAYTRLVRPISVGSRSGLGDLVGDEYLYCLVSGGDTRTYRLDGIERAEFAELAS